MSSPDGTQPHKSGNYGGGDGVEQCSCPIYWAGFHNALTLTGGKKGMVQEARRSGGLVPA